MFHSSNNGHCQPQCFSRVPVRPQGLYPCAGCRDVLLPQQLAVLVHFGRGRGGRRQLLVVVAGRETRSRRTFENVFQLTIVPIHVQGVQGFVEDCPRTLGTVPVSGFGRKWRIRPQNRRSIRFHLPDFVFIIVIVVIVVGVAWVVVMRGIRIKLKKNE